ncbi:uncharacterized protein BDV17DRAFT_287967 [Aspergillus undulatus]|uniref:uncharacterized protein n=1 Tax=Aspergillus undulatus TaxID=1810928 RepID=UPI003CCD9359
MEIPCPWILKDRNSNAHGMCNHHVRSFDAPMMNNLNILPSYTSYFHITTTTTALSTSATYIEGILAGLTFPHIVDKMSRRTPFLLAACITLIFIALQAASQTIAMFIAPRIGLGFDES